MEKQEWKTAVWLALIAAIILEFAINLFAERTLWQRVTHLEERVRILENGEGRTHP